MCIQVERSSPTSFQHFEAKVIEAPVLSLQNFNLVFEVESHASGFGIEVVLTQEGKHITY